MSGLCLAVGGATGTARRSHALEQLRQSAKGLVHKVKEHEEFQHAGTHMRVGEALTGIRFPLSVCFLRDCDMDGLLWASHQLG